MKKKVSKMIKRGTLAIFFLKWLPTLLTQVSSDSYHLKNSTSFYDNESQSITYELQMDGKINNQPLIPPRIKSHNQHSSFCAVKPNRILKQLIAHYKTDVNDTNMLEDPPLHRAARLGREQEVAILLSSGIKTDTRGIFKRTPLHWAASNSFGSIIMLLIVKGANVNCKDKWGFTPLHLAVENNHKEAVELLKKNGALINTRNIDGRTPLHDAARNGYFDLIPLLMNNNASKISITKPLLSTPLHEATIGNHLEIVKYLIGKSANLNAMDEIKRTPLHWAVFYNYEEIAFLLMSKGAGLNRKDCDGLSPLHITAMKGYKKLTEVLIKNGAFKNSRTRKGHTPLHEAARNGQKEVVELLIKEGVELESGSQASDGSTPLFEAVEGGYSDIVKILINHGARFNITNNMGRTPLHRAVEKNNKEIVYLLIHKGAEITVEDYRGYTPYTIACEKGNMELLQQLFVYCVCYNYTKSCQCLSVGNDIVGLPPPCQCIAAKEVKGKGELIVNNKTVNFDKCPCFMIKTSADDNFEACTTIPHLNSASKGLCLKLSKKYPKFNVKRQNDCSTPNSDSVKNSTVCLGHVVKFVKNTLDNSIIFH